MSKSTVTTTVLTSVRVGGRRVLAFARCRRARDRYLTFAEANRLYRRDAQGNRVYYTGAEIDAERTAAEKAMKELCDGKPR